MEIFQKIRKIIADQLGVDESEITENSHLQDDLNSDPLSMADIMGNIEAEFSIKISNEDTEKFNTVKDIVEFVADQIGEV